MTLGRTRGCRGALRLPGVILVTRQHSLEVSRRADIREDSLGDDPLAVRAQPDACLQLRHILSDVRTRKGVHLASKPRCAGGGGCANWDRVTVGMGKILGAVA